jgi:hypothetical protein
MEKSSRRYTSEVYPAGGNDVCENLDIVHFRWLVVRSDREGSAPAVSADPDPRVRVVRRALR